MYIFISLRGNKSSPYHIHTRDCINGTWFPKGHFGAVTNYSHLINEFANRREVESNREENIDFEADLMIYNRTK